MKNFIGYIITLTIALVYFLFIDARAGSVFLAVLIISPIISIAMTLAVIKKIRISSESSATVLNKNNTVEFVTTFNKSGIFLSPFIVVKLYNSYNFSTKQKNDYEITLSSNKSEVITQTYISKVWGVGEIGIEQVSVTDFLGLKTFYLYRENGEKAYTKQFEICPDIPDYSQDNELLKMMSEEVAYSDNEETEDSNFSFSGLPGYEHRKYMPGDPLKKVNWKLSFKKNELLVRLDESSKLTKLNIVIDFMHSDYYNYDKLTSLLCEEKIVQASLMLLQKIVKLDLECNVYYYLDDGWHCNTIKTISDIYPMQYAFCKLKFKVQASNEQRIPLQQIIDFGGCKTIILFSCDTNVSLTNGLNNCKQNGINVQTVVAKSSQNMVENSWMVDANYDFIRLT